MSHAPTPESSQNATPVWSDARRELDFNHWLATVALQHPLRPETVRLASSDASFRRYFRVDTAQGSCIIMDAPPDKEDSHAFVKVAQLMQQAQIRAAEVLAWDEAKGFMMLTDLGAQTMMQVINPAQPETNLALYLQAVDTLIDWQLASQPGVLPPYDEALLRRELNLFPEWYITRHRGMEIDAAMQFTLDNTFKQIVAANLAWPSVYVHRDFMPRNLMVADAASETRLGVLDFQDAVYGPITYDIASLMRDAFLTWEEEFCLDITIRYWDKARKAGLPVGKDFGEFYRGVEWMGLQRHLKVTGIFARLTLRDGKPQYLADTPRFINYLLSTCARYIELKPLLRLIQKVEGIVEPNVFGFGASAR
jgi:aminoglycoside/choline kinase family phosphotransferase